VRERARAKIKKRLLGGRSEHGSEESEAESNNKRSAKEKELSKRKHK
jgi:hypothetical protein